MPSLADLGAALFSYFGIAVPIVASLYVGTKLAERKFEPALSGLAAITVLLAGWALMLPTAFSMENARCAGEHSCGAPQSDRAD
jgi:hypothetical protein